ncbi:SpaA isopeptide-forming pilin-related protein [Paraclostridium bifermentans]
MRKILRFFMDRRNKALLLSAFILAFGLALFIPKQLKALNMGTKGDLFIVLRKHKKFNGTYGIYTDYKPLSDGSVGYCMDSRKEAPPNGFPLYETADDIPHKALVAMKLGYPHRTWYNTGNAEMDRELNMYVTQCTIWGFQDGFGPAEVAQFYKAPDITWKYRNVDIEGMKNNIINFMHEVEAYKEPLDPAVWVDKTDLNAFTANSGQWLTTDQIGTGGRGIDGSLRFEVEGAPPGTVIKDGWSYKEINELGFGRPFYFDMPLQAESGSFRVRLKAVGTLKRIKKYTTNDSKYQRIGTYKEEPVNIDLYTPYITVNYGKTLGTMRIYKTDVDTGVRLPGATMRVTGPGGFNKTITTDGDGQYWLGDLPAGRYTVQEISAPDGYTLNSTPQTVDIAPGGSGNITISNKKKPLGLLQIEKKDPGGKTLAGAKFRVTQDSTGTVVAEQTTGSNGSIFIEKLPEGSYTIEELQAPVGYVGDTSPKHVSFFTSPSDTDDFKKVTVTNHERLGELEVIKKGADGKYLQGAEFEVVRKSDNKSMGKITTGSDGKAVMKNLTKGSYKVTETKAPTGYLISTEPSKEFEFFSDVGDTDAKRSFTFVNNQVKATAKLLKIDGDTGKSLPNAEFRIKGPNGYDITRKSGADGMVMLEHVPYGEYTVEELKAPTGYVISGPWNFKVEENGASLRVKLENHKIHGNIDLTKIDKETKKPIAGVQFKIVGPAGYDVTKTTDDKGKIHLENLVYGEYSITELKPAEGYLANTKTQTINVDTDGKTYPITIENDIQRGDIEITKIDKETKKPISDVEFNIKGPEGFNKTLSTDSRGIITLGNVRYGDYTIKETKPATGYLTNSKTYNIKVSEAGQKYKVTIDNDISRGNIKLTKIDTETKKPISGVAFRITGPEGFDTTKKTDDNGILTLDNVRYGDYNITEVAPAPGYLANTQNHKIEVRENGKLYAITVENTAKRSEIEILKVDKETKKPIPNVEFNVTGPVGYNKTGTTDSTGKLKLGGLRVGEYTIKETKAGTGYLLNGNTYKVNVTKGGETFKTEITNDIAKGNIKIVKVDSETKKIIAGATFRIVGPEGYDVTKTTDDKGVITLENVRYGDYTVTETKPATGYLPNTKSHKVEVRENGKLYTLTVENDVQRGNIKLTKTDSETKKPIKGATFKITGPEGYDVSKTTDDKGFITLTNVRYGDYKIVETKPAEGYLPNNTVHNITVNKHGSTFELSVENDIQRGNIKLLKKDQDLGIPVKGATFNITGPEGYNVTKETNNSGIITLENVRYGIYQVKETKPATGYQPTTKTWDVNVNANGKTFELEVTNKTIEGKIVIEKKDVSNSKPLEGAEFQIRSLDFGVDGDIPAFNERVKTNKDGKVEIPNLRFGNYEIRETQAPVGYILGSEIKKINIDGSKSEYKVDFTNQMVTGNLEILKTDKETGEGLAGAEFLVEGVTNKAYHKNVKTGENGTVRIEKIPYGEYRVVETKAPTGYVLDTTEHKFVIDKEGKEVRVTHSNRINKGHVEIIKTDSETHDKLANARFEIYNKAGTKMATLVTNKEGYAKSDLLNYGDYTMKEVQPPTGYNSNPKIYNIEIREDGKTYTYNIENNVIKGKIKIVKTDSLDNSILIPNIEFGIWKESQDPVKDKPLHVIKTNDKGEAITPDLRYGHYFVKETATRDDYYINNGKWDVFVDSNGKTYTVNIDNKPVTAKIKITKTSDQTGKALANAKFQIIDNKTQKPVSFSIVGKDGKIEPKTTFISDDKGVIEIPAELRFGSYTLTEVEAPTGFLVAEPIPFEVNKDSHFVDRDGDKWLEFSPIDKIIRGNVELTKTSKDAPDTKMSGVVFELSRVTNPEKHEIGKVGEYTTDANGKIVVKDLPYGEYYFKEIKTLEGYVLDETPIHFMIQENGKTIELGMDNRWIRGSVELSKTDIDTKETIEGVTFELYGYKGEDRKLLEEYKTNSKGIIEVKDLPYGKYEFVEKKTLDNYVLDETPQVFFVQEDKGSLKLSMTNEKIKGDFKITKTDVADGKALPNAGFKIYAEDKKTVIAEGKTNDEGIAYFEKLIYGKYYYQEFDAPEGYVIDESLFPFEIKEDGKIVKAEMTNEKIKGTLELTKTDISTGELLPKAHFAVFVNEGTKDEPKRGDIVAKGITDDKGICKLDNLDYGKYVYQETEAPEGYILNDALMPFEITEDGSIIKSDVSNRKITGKLRVLKVDKKDDKPLGGAYFEVYNREDKEGKQPLFKGQTDKDGKVEFKDIVYGDYYVEEVRAPEGYSLGNDTTENFSVEEQGDSSATEFKNTKIELAKTGTVRTYGMIGLGVAGVAGVTFVTRRKR